MITVEVERRDDGYVLGRTDTEYERLRAQSRVWEAATGRLLDRVVQDYDLQSVSVQPALDSFEEAVASSSTRSPLGATCTSERAS